MTPTESDIQFLARALIATREGGQISSSDAQRLGNLAQYGDSLHRTTPTTLPEERRSAAVLPGEVKPGEEYPVVSG